METIILDKQDEKMRTFLKGTIREAVSEALEDIAFGKAIEEGLTSERVSRKAVFGVLEKKKKR